MVQWVRLYGLDLLDNLPQDFARFEIHPEAPDCGNVGGGAVMVVMKL